MKYKLTPTERTERTERRRKLREDETSRREASRDWFETRRIAAQKRNRKAAEARRAQARGVDRVPARYQVHPPTPEFVVEHTSANREQRRSWALGQGRNMPAAGNVPHVNPARDKKRGARLRKQVSA